ncbi:MAG: hypothetical protein ACPG4Z_03820 [Chitinophagales bacterium]
MKVDTIKHLKGIYFGGNWTSIHLKDVLVDISWEQATFDIVDDMNNIATLTYHSTYFVQAIIDVLEGNPLSTKDKESFYVPTINCEADWQKLQENAFQKVNYTIELLEQSSDDILTANFGNEKYGSIYSNIHGIIEHLHYHLGQIVVLKKMIGNQSKNT